MVECTFHFKESWRLPICVITKTRDEAINIMLKDDPKLYDKVERIECESVVIDPPALKA